MKRNWKKYNQALVRRGEIMLSFDAIESWGPELKEMNHKKEGHSVCLSRVIHGGPRMLPCIPASSIQANRRPDKITPQRKDKNANVFCHLEESKQA